MRSRCLLTGGSLSMAAAVALAGACSSGSGGAGGGPDGGAPNPAVLFIVDATSALISFDAQGNRLGSVPLGGQGQGGRVDERRGGGIALASGNLYVTAGSSVFSYTTGLVPSPLPSGAFGGLSEPRGIDYDPVSSVFFVADGTASIDAYDPNGSPATVGLFPFHDGPSGVAYDADDDVFWVANYAGSPASGTPQTGVEDYAFDGTARDRFDYSKQFVGPQHTQPYAIAVCSKASRGQTTIVVGFIDDGSGQGQNAVYSFSTTGTLLGGTIDTFVSPPHQINALSCTPDGRVFVADDTTLWATAGTWPAPGTYTAPVYGVFAALEVGSAAPDGGGGAGGGGGGGGGGVAGGGGGGGGAGGGGGTDSGSPPAFCVPGQPFTPAEQTADNCLFAYACDVTSQTGVLSCANPPPSGQANYYCYIKNGFVQEGCADSDPCCRDRLTCAACAVPPGPSCSQAGCQ